MIPLQFLTVQKRCVEFLLHTLNETNALQYFTLGDMIGVPELSRQSLAYLLYHFDNISESRRELFSQLHVELLIKYLGHPNLNCESEVDILCVINRWKFDQSDNVSDEKILKLFSCARFGTLSATDLQTGSALPFIQESKTLSKLMTVIGLRLEEDVTVKACKCCCHSKSGTTSPTQMKTDGCQACQQSGGDATDADDSHREATPSNNKPITSWVSTRDCRLKRMFRKSCCSKNKETLIESDDDEEVKVCFPLDMINLADELLSTPPRSPPFVPCVVGHVRKPESPSGI